jgi:serine/threonine-protein kinase
MAFKPLAVRILDTHLSQRPDVVRMFLDEQRAAAVLQHPRIAAVHEVGAMPDGSYFVACEYVHGVPLREVMRSPQAQLSASNAVHISMQLCDALHYAHERYDVTGKPLEIVHGQISSDAVLIGFDGNIKLIEFGCLRTRNATVSNVSVPTKLQRRTSYMSPELRAQAQSTAAPVLDRRADIYSVGVLLWEMLTGETLTTDDNDEPPPPPSQKHDSPPELDAIVKKALAKNKEDRYPTALALRLALSQTAAQIFGESSVTTILARNMTVAFRQRLVAFQEQLDVWRKFEPEVLPNEPMPAAAPPVWRANPTTGGPASAYQSQRLSTHQSQRLHVGGMSPVANSANRHDSTGGRLRHSGDISPIYKKPLFFALLLLGVVTVIVALVVTLTRDHSSPWAIYVDSQPRGAEIRIDGKIVGNTPQRISNTAPPSAQKLEVMKKGFRSEVREVLPQAGETVHIEIELKPDESQ